MSIATLDRHGITFGVVRMKFFSNKILTKEHVFALKSTLKFYSKDKIINYNNNFLDVIEMEKGVYVKDRDNEIFALIEEYLEPWLDDWKIMQMQIESGMWVEYDYRLLPSKLKQYMYLVDSMLYEIWYRDVTGRNIDYDSRLNKLSSLDPDYEDNDFIEHVLLGKPLPTTLGKKASDSARRSYRVVNEIIKSNIDLFESFLTLTFATNDRRYRHIELNSKRAEGESNIEFQYVDASDFELTKKKFTGFMDNLRKRLKRKGILLEYIAVWELQGNGNYHFHILSTRIPEDELYKIPEWLDYNHIKKERYNGFGLSAWTYGKSDCQEIKDKARLTTYVSKYIIKSFQNVNPDTYNDYLGKKKYFVTNGLKRPTISYVNDYSELEEKESFIKTYINPYNNGLITKKQYTLVQ